MQRLHFECSHGPVLSFVFQNSFLAHSSKPKKKKKSKKTVAYSEYTHVLLFLPKPKTVLNVAQDVWSLEKEF